MRAVEPALVLHAFLGFVSAMLMCEHAMQVLQCVFGFFRGSGVQGAKLLFKCMIVASLHQLYVIT